MTNFKVFTKDDYDVIPKNLFLVKNKYGWLFLVNEKAQWFVNHTNDFKNCKDSEDLGAIKAILKQIKINKKIIKDEAKK